MKKNITRRLMTALLAAAMCVSMAACGSKTDDTKTDGTGDAGGAKKYTIGVCQVVEEYLTGKGITCTCYSFSDSNDVAAVTTKAAADSDVIYIPTDNTAASCTEAINNVAEPAGVPIVAGEEGICKGCGIATLSIDYYELGKTTGAMAAKILTGEANVSEMPIEYYQNPVKKYDAASCEALGITVPADYVAIG